MSGTLLTSFAGVALQVTGGAAYDAWLLEPDSPYARDSTALLKEVAGRLPKFVRTQPLGGTLVLHVFVRSGGLQTMQDLLSGVFSIGRQGDLVADFGGSSRRVNAIVKQVLPYAAGAVGFNVVLAAPDPRWKSAAFENNASGFPSGTIGLINSGTIADDEAVFTFTPMTVKPNTHTNTSVMECRIANRVPRTYTSEAINVAGTAFNHAAEVTAGRSLASGDDVRVFVDGLETSRWRGEAAGTTWNQATTQVWINLTLSPALTAILAVACASGVSPANGGAITVQKGNTTGWPDAGAFMLEDELITYTGKTDSTFTGITRGARGSTAAAHSISPELTLYWVERRVQIIYGNLAATAPPANDNLKPLIDLSASTNLIHKWSDFTNTRKPRSMQWSGVQDLTRDRLAGHMALKTDGLSANGDLPGLRIEFYQDPTKHDQRPGNIWRRNFPSPVTSVDMLFTNSAYQTVGILLAIDENGKEREVVEMKNGSGLALGATAVDNATQLAIFSRLYTAIQSYDASPVPAVVDLSTLAPEPNERREPFTVPELTRPLGYVEEVVLPLKVTGGSVDATLDLVQLMPNSPGGGTLSTDYVLVSASVTVTLTNTTFQDVRFVFGAGQTPSMRKDDVLYLRLRRTAASSGAQHLFWNGGAVLYMGATQAQTFTIQSLSLDQADNVLGGNGIFFSVDDLTVTYAAATVPYLALGPRQAIYFVNCVWTNTTTGQVLTLAAYCSLSDVITVDVGARTVRNTTTGEDLFYAATFSDPANWFTIVPGTNTFSYAETDVVSMQVTSKWSDRWA